MTRATSRKTTTKTRRGAASARDHRVCSATPLAEAALLAAYRSGRVPHAFLIAGPQGIGKATLAYRMARFVLAHPDPAAPRRSQAATSLAVDPDHPVARRIAAQAQPDLLVIERTLNDKGVLHKQIAVDDIRRTVGFFGSTAGEGGWRIAIVDAVDELNRSGANALLKVLEEPPERALLLLGQPFRGARAGDAALALPHPHAAAARPRPMSPRRVAAATGIDGGRSADCRRRRGRRRLGGARFGVPRRAAPWRCASRRSTCSTACRRSTPRRCMRSARRWPAPTRSRSRPSSTPSMPGCRSASTAGRPRSRRLARLGRGLGAHQRRRARRRNLQSRAQAAGFQRFRLACRGDARLIPTLMSANKNCPASPITSPPRSLIRTARRISATPMRRSPPTPSRASCGSTAATCSSSPAPTSTASKCCRRRPRKSSRRASWSSATCRASRPWCKRFNCSNDDFIRTTEPRHHRSSEAIWQRMEAAGDIYLDKYSGWYSVRDEAYYDESETRLDDKGPRLGPQGTPVEWVEEESYFFRLSALRRTSCSSSTSACRISCCRRSA